MGSVKPGDGRLWDNSDRRAGGADTLVPSLSDRTLSDSPASLVAAGRSEA